MFVGPIYLTPHHHPHAPARRLPTRSCSGHRRTRYAEHPTDFGNGQPFVAWRLVLRSCVVRPFGQSFPQPAVEPTLQRWFPSVENVQPIPLAAPGGSKFEIAVYHFCSRSIRPAVGGKTEATMKKQEELVIITKTYDLILWSCNDTGRFPRQHRFEWKD